VISKKRAFIFRFARIFSNLPGYVPDLPGVPSGQNFQAGEGRLPFPLLLQVLVFKIGIEESTATPDASSFQPHHRVSVETNYSN